MIMTKMGKDDIEHPPLLGSMRLLVAFSCLLATFFRDLVKFGLSTAIVCMRGTTANATDAHDAIEVRC